MNVDILQNISHSNKSVSTKYPLSLSTRSTILYSRHEKAPCANAGKHTDQIEYSISDQKKKSKEKHMSKKELEMFVPWMKRLPIHPIGFENHFSLVR